MKDYQATKEMVVNLFQVASSASHEVTITTSLIEAQQALLATEQLFEQLTSAQQATEASRHEQFIAAAATLNLSLVKSLDYAGLAFTDEIAAEYQSLVAFV